MKQPCVGMLWVMRSLTWSLRPAARPARKQRLVFAGAGLVLLGASYVWTGSVGVQTLVVFALVFGVLPILSRAARAPDPYMQTVQQRHVPPSVLAASLGFGIAWGALTAVVVPEELGPWFWMWLVMWPWAEVLAYLGERRLERDGADAWKPVRPLRDSALAGALTAPLTFVLMLLLDESGAGEAAMTGAACGVVVFFISLTFTKLNQQAPG